MSHPMPESPTNVQYTNPYTGVDRGLMLLNGLYTGAARIHAARWISNGPAGAVSRIEFQVMQYTKFPSTPAEYAAGKLMKAPDGSTWFDCLARGDCSKPIMVEYYARNVFQTYYCVAPDAHMLENEVKENSKAQATEFVRTIGRSNKVWSLELIMAFNATSTSPLAESSLQLEFSYGDADHPTQGSMSAMPSTAGNDPVRAVIDYVKSKG